MLFRSAEAKKTTAAAVMFPVADALLLQPNTSRNSGMGTRGFSGQNPPVGAKLGYYLSRDVATDAKMKIEIVDAAGTVVRGSDTSVWAEAALDGLGWVAFQASPQDRIARSRLAGDPPGFLIGARGGKTHRVQAAARGAEKMRAFDRKHIQNMEQIG